MSNWRYVVAAIVFWIGPANVQGVSVATETDRRIRATVTGVTVSKDGRIFVNFRAGPMIPNLGRGL